MHECCVSALDVQLGETSRHANENPSCGCTAADVPQSQLQQHLWRHAKLLEQLDSGKHIVTTRGKTYNKNLAFIVDHTPIKF